MQYLRQDNWCQNTTNLMRDCTETEPVVLSATPPATERSSTCQPHDEGNSATTGTSTGEHNF